MKDLLWVTISQRAKIVTYRQDIDDEQIKKTESMKKYLMDCELKQDAFIAAELKTLDSQVTEEAFYEWAGKYVGGGMALRNAVYKED